LQRVVVPVHRIVQPRHLRPVVTGEPTIRRSRALGVQRCPERQAGLLVETRIRGVGDKACAEPIGVVILDVLRRAVRLLRGEQTSAQVEVILRPLRRGRRRSGVRLGVLSDDAARAPCVVGARRPFLRHQSGVRV